MRFSDTIRQITATQGPLVFMESVVSTDSDELKQISWLLTFGFINTVKTIHAKDKKHDGNY